jgi:hypothetical protein
MDVLKMDGEADIYHQYPFRQTYVEASGWINDDNIYYKIGIDKFDDFKKNIDNPFSISALTFPSLFTFNILKNSSVTIYAEYQAREEINRMPDLLVERTDNYTDQYYSLTYNHPSLFSVTYFYRQELYKGEWGEFWDEQVGGDYDDLYGPPSNSGNIESWQGIDVTYKINTSTQISLFTGSQKGGLICANGICAVQPGFDDGYKITFRSLF